MWGDPSMGAQRPTHQVVHLLMNCLHLNSGSLSRLPFCVM